VSSSDSSNFYVGIFHSTSDYYLEKNITKSGIPIYSEYGRLAGSLHGLQLFIVHGNTVLLDYAGVVPIQQSPRNAETQRASDTSVK